MTAQVCSTLALFWVGWIYSASHGERAKLINGITINHRITIIYSVFKSIADQLDLEPKTAPIDSWHLLSFSETDSSILGTQLFED